jgi:hypothetical protein
MHTPYPELNARAQGGLKFVHRKATTPDDRSWAGEPRSWWDHSTPPMTNFPRFDDYGDLGVGPSPSTIALTETGPLPPSQLARVVGCPCCA